MNFGSYQTGDFYDELFRSAETPREEFRMLVERIDSLPEGELLRRQRVAERDLMHMGITFNVYGDERGQERIFPFDLVPRLVTSHEWDWLEKGLQQRVRALNLFIDDVYHDQKIVKDRIIPQEIIRSAQGFQEACVGLNPPQGIWCHITGTDIVRDSDGRMYVLEDNLRVPSGVSYVLQNRLVLKQTSPKSFRDWESGRLTTIPAVFWACWRMLRQAVELGRRSIYRAAAGGDMTRRMAWRSPTVTSRLPHPQRLAWPDR